MGLQVEVLDWIALLGVPCQGEIFAAFLSLDTSGFGADCLLYILPRRPNRVSRRSVNPTNDTQIVAEDFGEGMRDAKRCLQ